MNVFLQASAANTTLLQGHREQPKCTETNPLLVLEPVYSLGSPGSAAHYGVNMPSSSLAIRHVWQGLIFREELGGRWD